MLFTWNAKLPVNNHPSVNSRLTSESESLVSFNIRNSTEGVLPSNEKSVYEPKEIYELDYIMTNHFIK